MDRIVPLRFMAATVVCLTVASALTGCGPRRADYVGTWQGEQSGLLAPGATDDAIAKTIRRVTLEVKQDGTFTLLKAGFPHTGRITASGDSAKLVVETVLGRPVHSLGDREKALYSGMSVTLTDADTLELSDEHDFNRPPIELKRESSSGE